MNWATGFTPEGRPIVNPDKVPSYTYEAKDIGLRAGKARTWEITFDASAMTQRIRR